MPLNEPEHLPGDVQRTWVEVRGCLAIGATTAAVMLCRKLLLHMAVQSGLPAKNAKERSPSFEECVLHLQTEGVVTKAMQPWVDRIRVVGNEANHELTQLTPEAAMDIAQFTLQLLRLKFELSAMAVQSSPEDAIGMAADRGEGFVL